MYSRVREINDDIKDDCKESKRASTTESDDPQYSYAEHVFAAPERVNGKDGVLRRHAANSRNENSQHRNQVIVGDDRVDKRSSKVEDTAVTDECRYIPCVKESLTSPVQETKSGNRRFETQLATTVHSKHKTNPAKTIVQEQSVQLTSPFSSDDYKTFEQGQDENTRPKVIDDIAAFDYTMADSNSSAFMSVAGCSDSFVSVRQNKLDTDSHSIGTSEGEKNSGHVLTKENSFKSSQVGKSPENEGQLQKQISSPHFHDYYPPGLLSESSKEDLVLPLPAQGINDEGAESSNCICSKHDEEIASETPVLPMGNGDVNSHQASTSYSKQTKLTDTAETENTTQSLESNLDDESNSYENMTVNENKEQNIFSTEEQRIKRDSNIRTKSSDSDSSTDSVTYETPDEGAQHENGIVSQIKFVRDNMKHFHHDHALGFVYISYTYNNLVILHFPNI
ncbi:uncharacterized protein LOC132723982 [Ruditapes philippinarum]|uniref:uncharacterized protein LOC132723982 n=1 Tax=Ruditapes philippinarum TaxID=129788 RepID=UPI00295AB283|nr:uncharacterized protein LOC132723982 [Ruditapes philippinarum]